MHAGEEQVTKPRKNNFCTVDYNGDDLRSPSPRETSI